ncbi:MAG: hypothetical protein M3N19_01295 [Candidatus Eremiobacteraeota bacterium]|nr:hypothetical protein [Candidatus Eremiobacteraeota bacterium]
MRRPLAVFALLSAVALMGAAHRGRPAASPAPTPSPTPTASAAPIAPVVVLYPFTVNGDADKNAGNKMVTLFAAQMTASGGLIVKPVPAVPVQRADYLTNALKNGADYYISGYMTPLGDEVALVEQVVSTSSGAIVWSSTATVLTYGDALTQADTIKKVVIGHAGRVEASYKQQQALATPPPGPANGAQTSIGSILGLLHRSHSGPAPRPTLAPDKKPARIILVVGHDDTANALIQALEGMYRVTHSATVTQNVAADAHTVCGSITNATIAEALARTEFTKSLPRYSLNVVTLRVYRCDGSILFQKTARASSLGDAMDQAVGAYISAHPSNG